MMRRLGQAMVDLIRDTKGDSKFLVVEAAPLELADAICGAWDRADQALPALAIASANPARFGGYGLVGASAATLRNENPRGVCVVVCEGYDLAERQSIASF